MEYDFAALSQGHDLGIEIAQKVVMLFLNMADDSPNFSIFDGLQIFARLLERAAVAHERSEANPRQRFGVAEHDHQASFVTGLVRVGVGNEKRSRLAAFAEIGRREQTRYDSTSRFSI